MHALPVSVSPLTTTHSLPHCSQTKGMRSIEHKAPLPYTLLPPQGGGHASKTDYAAPAPSAGKGLVTREAGDARHEPDGHAFDIASSAPRLRDSAPRVRQGSRTSVRHQKARPATAPFQEALASQLCISGETQPLAWPPFEHTGRNRRVRFQHATLTAGVMCIYRHSTTSSRSGGVVQ